MAPVETGTAAADRAETAMVAMGPVEVARVVAEASRQAVQLAAWALAAPEQAALQAAVRLARAAELEPALLRRIPARHRMAA